MNTVCPLEEAKATWVITFLAYCDDERAVVFLLGRLGTIGRDHRTIAFQPSLCNSRSGPTRSITNCLMQPMCQSEEDDKDHNHMANTLDLAMGK